jgi:hypothetical protein
VPDRLLRLRPDRQARRQRPQRHLCCPPSQDQYRRALGGTPGRGGRHQLSFVVDASERPPAELARRIHRRSHLTGEFTLRCGAISNEYFDKYLFESDPQLLREIAEALLALLPPDVDALAGLELGGVLLATVCDSDRWREESRPPRARARHRAIALARA